MATCSRATMTAASWRRRRRSYSACDRGPGAARRACPSAIARSYAVPFPSVVARKILDVRHHTDTRSIYFPSPTMRAPALYSRLVAMTLDAISADCMRHVVEGVGKIAREALGLK